MKRSRRNSGMTMVEVIISMAIICIAALMILSAISVSQSMIRRGVDHQEDARASLIAAEGGATPETGNLTVTFYIDETDQSKRKGYTVSDGQYYIGIQGGTELAAFVPPED